MKEIKKPIDEKFVNKIIYLKRMIETVSLNTPVKGAEDESENELIDFLEYDGPTPDELVCANDTRVKLKNELNFLKPREYRVISLRYGLDDNYPNGLRLKEIGDMFGVSRERVRQIEANAMRKIRVHFKKKNMNREDF